jgi:hypothetical protein
MIVGASKLMTKNRMFRLNPNRLASISEKRFMRPNATGAFTYEDESSPVNT